MGNGLKKLGWKNQPRVALINAPGEIHEALAGALPQVPDTLLDGSYDFIMYFAAELAAVRSDKSDLVGALAKEGRLWICYPKKTSKK